MYTERQFSLIEIATEFLLLFTSILIQMCLVVGGSDPETLTSLSKSILTLIITMICLNALYIVHVSVRGLKEKLRKKKIEQRKKQYEEAQEKYLERVSEIEAKQRRVEKDEVVEPSPPV